MNERLRRAMHRAGFDVRALADAVGVSTKSVERWLSGEVTPYPNRRYQVAALVREDATYLWPEAHAGASLTGAELIATYPRRNDVPRDLWTELLRSADRQVDVLAFAGLFLVEEHPDWTALLAEKAQSGARVRLLLGDPDGRQLASRDDEDRIDGAVSGRVGTVLTHYRTHLASLVEVRLFDAPLYNSIYRFDDDMLVNVHAFGILAAFTPTMHLRRIDGRFFATYAESFDRLWASARAW